MFKDVHAYVSVCLCVRVCDCTCVRVCVSIPGRIEAEPALSVALMWIRWCHILYMDLLWCALAIRAQRNTYWVILPERAAWTPLIMPDRTTLPRIHWGAECSKQNCFNWMSPHPVSLLYPEGHLAQRTPSRLNHYISHAYFQNGAEVALDKSVC